MRSQKSNFPVFVSGIDGYQNWVRINEFQNKYKQGDYTKLADKSGYSVSHVWRVMNGQRGPNKQIVSQARRMVRNRQSSFSF